MITTSFYNDLLNVKKAKDTLVKNLNATSDIKYSARDSFDTLASGVLNRKNTTNVSPVDYSDYIDHYWLEDRPKWYPNTKEILNTAPEITVDGTVYYPLYIMLITATKVSNLFAKAGTPKLGADAYLFSDLYDETSETKGLIVGTSVTHIWDETKDIKDPTDLKSEAVRWCIAYGKSKSVTWFFSDRDNSTNHIDITEIITGDCTVGMNGYQSGDITYQSFLEYLCFQDSTTITSISSSGTAYKISNNDNLKSVILPNSLKKIYNSSTSYPNYGVFASCPSLNYIKLPDEDFTIKCLLAQSCTALRKLKLPKNTKVEYANFLNALNSLEELDLSNVTSFKGNTFTLGNYNYSLKKIVLGDNKNSILVSVPYAYNLTDVEVNKFSGLSSAYAFKGDIIVESSSISVSGCPNVTGVTCNGGFTVCNVISCDAVKYVTINTTATGTLTGGLSGLPNLEVVNISEGITGLQITTSTTSKPLRYFKLPTTITIGYTSANICQNALYVELWNDFDLSYNFGDNNYKKSIEWLKDLCVWVKDNRGVTAKTLTLGSKIKTQLQAMYLTYDADTVNNITWVDSTTEGAINAAEYLTNVKNWTIS